MDNSAYSGLIQITKKYSETFKALNLQTINLMQSKELKDSLQSLAFSSKQLSQLAEKSMPGTISALGEVIPRYYSSGQQLSSNLQTIADSYRKLFRKYEFTALKESTRLALEQSQMTSIAQLCLSYETPMIHDAIGCFANADYEYLPEVLNQAMKGARIGAADVSFLKTGTIIPIIEKELKYPNGFKTALSSLNKSAAGDIAGSAEIEYDTRDNTFVSSESKVDSRSMNIVCAGLDVFGQDDIFTEVELMDFISFLSRTPMGGGFTETGRKIHMWLQDMLLQGKNTISFDQDLYYHCRSRKENTMPYTYDEMMKAPYGLPSAGRFNQTGRAHFYFASSKSGAEAEVKKHLKRDEILQTVMLKPVKSIKLLDLSGTLLRGKTFLRMIRFPLQGDSNKMPKEYLLPCYVADCCKMIGFDGIKFYGSKEYSNYVSWTDGYFEDAGMCK